MDNFEAIEAAYVTFVAEHQAAINVTVDGFKLGLHWTTVEEGQRSAIYTELLSKIPALKEAYENAQQ